MAAITSAAIGVGVSGYQIYQGQKEKKDAKKALNNYERVELENVYENMQVSTVGTDIMRDELNRGTASMVDAIQQGGSRSVTAALPKLQQGINRSAQEMRSELDGQVNDRNRLIASDNASIRSMSEQRDNMNLGAISSQYQAGQQNQWSGMLGATSGISSMARATQSIGSENTDTVEPTEPNDIISNDVASYSMDASKLYDPNFLASMNFTGVGDDFINKKLF